MMKQKFSRKRRLMTKNLFFDLDGTLISPEQRMYKLFCELCPENNFSCEEYWSLKRKKINQNDFLKNFFNYSDEEISRFKKNWLEKIEEKKRLTDDKPIENIEKLLKKLSQNYKLFIVTNRQDKKFVIEQIKNFGWFDFFDKILITEQKRTKADLIKEYVVLTSGDIFIGDTGEDILTAKELGIKSIAVTYGFLDKEILQEYNPDIIIEKVEDFDNCQFI